MNTKKTRRTIV